MSERSESKGVPAVPGRNALIVVDVQQGFDAASWGETTNKPGAEANVRRLIHAWEAAEQPVVVVRHDSVSPDSPLRPGWPGNDLKPEARVAAPALVIAKTVNSAFYGTPALEPWLRVNGIGAITVVGIQTNMCVETTARMAGNLGYDVTVPLDATRTFDLSTELPDGTTATLTADELMRATAINLQAGGFARVVSTDAAIAALAPAPPAAATGSAAASE
ncbi:MAG: cysteine hydrolase [Microbacteriaceae bacterium]|nr:cysteine hydrolase [Microbacteriaceae bacterium]